MEQPNNILPVLSIVIATRNRIAYAISAIQSILEISDPRLELVVQDNSDSRDLEAWIVGNVFDPRLRYHYSDTPLSFIHNFDAAARLATGEYVCFIGDDDGVNPEIIEAAAWAKGENLDALIVRQPATYIWPGAGIPSTRFTAITEGVMRVGSIDVSLKQADMEKEMQMLVRNGGLYYLDRDLPKLYHGLVHRRCLQSVYKKTGAYFGGLSPDTYASLAISCVAKKVMSTSYPLTISGMCKVSGSVVEGAIKRHSKKLEDAPHLRHRGEYHWCNLVPRVYCGETIWVDSSIAALRAMGRDDLVRQINLSKLAASCIDSNRGITRPVLRGLFMGLRVMGRNPVIGVIQLIWHLLILKTASRLKFARRIWNRILIIMGMKVVRGIHGLPNMIEASHALSGYLKANGYRFSDCVSRKKIELRSEQE